MKAPRVIDYGDFAGMSPLCQVRISKYADSDNPIDPGNPADREDAQHQWAYGHDRIMQECFEDGCEHVRPVPLHGYSEHAQVFIMQSYIAGAL